MVHTSTASRSRLGPRAAGEPVAHDEGVPEN